MKICLYGCGHRCRMLISAARNTDLEIMSVVDGNPEKWGSLCEGILVQSPDQMDNTMHVCVTFYSPLIEDPIWEEMHIKWGFDYDKIHSFHDIMICIYEYHYREMKKKTIENKEWKVYFDASWGFGFGGVESWLQDIVAAFAKEGSKNIFLLSKKKQLGVSEGLENRICEFCYKETPLFDAENVRKSIDKLLNIMPCFVVFSRVDELLLAAYILKGIYPNDIRIIMTDHGSCDGMYHDILSYREAIDYYVCVSNGIRNVLIDNGINEKRIAVMTCPVIAEKKFVRNYPLDEKEPIRLGYAGRLEVFEKRMDILKELIQELENRNVNYIFDIAGSGSYESELSDYIKNNNLCNKVKLVGRLPRSEMPEFWKKHDIAVNTSDNEGRPISNMEAMMNGAVPVVTETIGILDDVKNGVNGYIVPLLDYQNMADKIQYLSRNRELIKKYGEAAREELLTKSSMKKHIELWNNIFDEVRVYDITML